MRAYELTVVLPGKTTPAKKRQARETIEKMVKVLNGKVGEVSDWGEKELAYPIAKNTSGVFLHFPLELDSEGARALPEKLNLEEDILRFLLIKKIVRKKKEGKGK